MAFLELGPLASLLLSMSSGELTLEVIRGSLKLCTCFGPKGSLGGERERCLGGMPMGCTWDLEHTLVSQASG